VNAAALSLAGLMTLAAVAIAEGQSRWSAGTTAPAASPAPSTTGTRAKNDSQPVTVNAEKMERFGKESLTIFTGNVVARQTNNVQYADRMEVYFDEKEDRILRMVSTGNVRIITSDCRTGTARRAEYYDLDQRMVLTGNARVWQEDNVVSGETITIYISQDRSVVQGGKQERVTAIFYPKDQQQKTAAAAPPRGAAPPCAN
jgi:lipopolysaccharide export system protein LptA